MGNRMPQNIQNRKCSRAALCAVSSIAVLVAGSAAVRAGDDTGGDQPYTKFFNNMLSNMGLRDKDPDIEYKERPPLVVPPSRDLPAPVAGGSPSAKNAAWPTDDKRRSAAKPKKERSVLTDKPDDTTPTSQSDGSEGSMWSRWTNWNSLLGNNKESATFVHEPDRTTLTEPPAGYRTPSPTQPYGINGLADKAKRPDTEKQNDIVNGSPAPK
jgi:hypothetical protein